jgi:AraC family transcriptional regulator
MDVPMKLRSAAIAHNSSSGFAGRPGVREWRAPGITVGLADYAPNRVRPAHAHETLGISVVLRGTVEERAGTRTEIAGAASAVIKPSGTVHSNRFGPAGARLLAVELSPDRAAALFDEHGSLDQWRWTRVIRTLGIAGRALVDLSANEPYGDEAAEHLVVELVAALDRDVRAQRGAPPPWLRLVRERLEEEFASPCRVRDLAALAGVHPVHLARRFRTEFGLSVLEYLRTVRVRSAVRELADADRPLSEVALGAGFADQSHLTRVLRATTGLTPRRYRELARSA